MQIIAFAEFLYDIHVVNAIYIYPCNRLGVPKWKAFLYFFRFFLFKLRFVVVDDSNPHIFGLALTDVYKGARGKSGRLRPFG
jgi:hypothetical protein